MPPRPKRPQFTQADIDQQLQQIHLLDPSSTSENLEQLAPIIKSVYESGRQEAFLRALSGLVESKEAEIERICGDNYQDFVSSVSTLLTVRSYTANLRERISSLDSSVKDVGSSLARKKKQLLQNRRTAAHLDEAIDTLQACLRVLDLVSRVGDMVKGGKYYTALRSLDDIQNLPPSSLSQTPFLTHLLSSLPSLRAQIKDAVTASTKSWLLQIRESSALVGQLALEAVEQRGRRWRGKREREGLGGGGQMGVGSAVEVATNEKIDFDPLENDQIQLDFKPIYQSILIYTAMGQLDELQASYQEDRKTQAALILAHHLSTPLTLPALPALIHELAGFFIIESRLALTTASFRSQKEVEELWEGVVPRVGDAVERAVREERDTERVVAARQGMVGIAQALETHGYDTSAIHTLLFRIFERYVTVISDKFARAFEDIVAQDDLQPMTVNTDEDFARVLGVCWLDPGEMVGLTEQRLPVTMPFSHFFPLYCVDIRTFIEKFYVFLEGSSENRRDVDDLLRRTLDSFIANHICKKTRERLGKISQPSQIAQIIVNVEHVMAAGREMEKELGSSRTYAHATSLHLDTSPLQTLLSDSISRIQLVIRSKLDDFFGLAEYDWTPSRPEQSPSMYLVELVNWLFTVVESLAGGEDVKERCFEDAMDYLGECFMEFLVGRSVSGLNELGIANLLVDVDFIESEFSRRGKPAISARFATLRTFASIILQDAVSTYIQPASRRRPQGLYANVEPRLLAELLGKLARGAAGSRVAGERERAERRRREAIEVGRLV